MKSEKLKINKIGFDLIKGSLALIISFGFTFIYYLLVFGPIIEIFPDKVFSSTVFTEVLFFILFWFLPITILALIAARYFIKKQYFIFCGIILGFMIYIFLGFFQFGYLGI